MRWCDYPLVATPNTSLILPEPNCFRVVHMLRNTLGNRLWSLITLDET